VGAGTGRASAGPGSSCQQGFLWCLKANFSFSAVKHSHDFCFTSVIAYNSMKFQPERISLAADREAVRSGSVLFHRGIGGREAGSPGMSRLRGQPPLQAIPGWGWGCSGARLRSRCGIRPGSDGDGEAGEGWAGCALGKARICYEPVACPARSVLSLSFGGLQLCV